jgi:hypothetical protein
MHSQQRVCSHRFLAKSIACRGDFTFRWLHETGKWVRSTRQSEAVGPMRVPMSIFGALFSVSLIGTVIGGGAAGATTASQSATARCPVLSTNGICISQINVDYTTTAVTLTMTVGAATNPTTDTNWSNSDTNVHWDIFTASTTTASYTATASLVAGQFGATVENDATSATACGGTNGATASVDTTANTYTITFPASCLGSPSSFTVHAYWSYASGGTTNQEQLPAASEPPCCSVTQDPATQDPATRASSTSSATTTTASTSTTTSTTSTTTTTTPSSTTTTSAAPAVVTSPSTGNTGGTPPLALTGPGADTPALVVVALCLIAIGTLGRRRVFALVRRAKRSRTR